MPSLSNKYVSGTLKALAAACLIYPAALPSALASEAMPVTTQNALVQKYCAVCHTDAARNGGLSLQHFDAATVAPSLAAMLVAKITSGVLLETVQAAASDPAAAAFVAAKRKGGAMGAAGLPIPDESTIDALTAALALQARGAAAWHWNRSQDPATQAPVLTASILRELPSANNQGRASFYRLLLSCNISTHQGGMQLSWAPMPTRGVLSVTADGRTTVTYKVEGAEKMGNGNPVTTGPAAIDLSPAGLFPAHHLSIKDLFPGESVEFPLGELPPAARQSLAACLNQALPGQ